MKKIKTSVLAYELVPGMSFELAGQIYSIEAIERYDDVSKVELTAQTSEEADPIFVTAPLEHVFNVIFAIG